MSPLAYYKVQYHSLEVRDGYKVALCTVGARKIVCEGWKIGHKKQ